MVTSVHPLGNGSLLADSPGSSSESSGNAVRLSLRGITKAFPGVIANQEVTVDIRAAEIHAILGENGAGKSTLMKILYGFYSPDAGTISGSDGRAVSLHSPADARRLGIGMVFQQFMLAPALTVLEDVALAEADLPFVLPRRRLEERIRMLSERYGFRVDPHAQVGNLSVGEQQKVEILKLLMAQAKVLIFDEPTSVLAPHESDALMDAFRKLRSDGLSVLFITHKLREVLAVADWVTVLRRGRVTASVPRAGIASAADIVHLMVGSDEEPSVDLSAGPFAREGLAPETTMPPPVTPSGSGPIVELSAVSVPDPANRMPLHDISLAVYAGEISWA